MTAETVWGLGVLTLVFVLILGLAFRTPKVRVLLLVAFVLRASLALFHHFIAPLPDSQADALMFERTARAWAAEGWNGLLNHWQSGALLYSWLLAFFYLLLGPSSLLAQAINVCLGTLSVYLVWRTAREFFDEHKALLAGWATCLFPTLNLYSAITMREALFVFLILWASFFALRWLKSKKLGTFACAAFFLVLATGFHLGAWPLLWGLGLWSLGLGFYRSFQNKKIPWPTLGELMLIAGASAFIVVFRWGWDKGGVFEAGIGNVQKAYAIGRAAYLQGLVAQNVWDLFWQAPLRTVYLLFTPFPWMVREPVDLIGLFDASLYVVLTFCILGSLMWLYRTNRDAFWSTIFLLSLATLGILAFAIITSNYGAAIRHRAKFVPFLLVAAAPTLWTITKRGKEIWKKRVFSS